MKEEEIFIEVIIENKIYFLISNITNDLWLAMEKSTRIVYIVNWPLNSEVEE